MVHFHYAQEHDQKEHPLSSKSTKVPASGKSRLFFCDHATEDHRNERRGIRNCFGDDCSTKGLLRFNLRGDNEVLGSSGILERFFCWDAGVSFTTSPTDDSDNATLVAIPSGFPRSKIVEVNAPKQGYWQKEVAQPQYFVEAEDKTTFIPIDFALDTERIRGLDVEACVVLTCPRDGQTWVVNMLG
jgi:hypothetical protein